MFLKTDVCTIVVLVLVFGQCSGAAFDEVCTINDDCTDSNTECAGSKKCACVAGFTKISSGCKAALDATCTITSDCADPHAECTGSTSKMCTCAVGYTKESSACKADIGTDCTATTDCDTTTTAAAVCDVLATPHVCKIKSTGDCSVKTDKCVSGAVCTSNACGCSTKYKENTDKLCAKVLGLACSTIAECNTVANSNCTGSSSKTCTCNTGYTQLGADCTTAAGGGLMNMMNLGLMLTSLFAVKIV